MHVVEIHEQLSGSTAKISLDQGFNCFEFKAVLPTKEVVSVLEAPADFASGNYHPAHYGIPILFPFPNRIQGGRYLWNGTEYAIPSQTAVTDDLGNAIHGFCFDRPWRMTQQSWDTVTAEFQLSRDAADRAPYWPSDAKIVIQYALRNSSLRADVTISNCGSQSLPWGFGTHPYFHVPAGPQSSPGDCTIYAPVRQRWELEKFVPTGRLIPTQPEASLIESPYFDTLKVDDVFTDLETQKGISVCRIIDEKAGVQIEQYCSAGFREVVAFTPPWSSSVCLEPYTCVTDAINLYARGIDGGLKVLEPGQSWQGWIEIEVSHVVC
ncbi:MAG: aldose 1-epimerase [Planctomyces sp.]|nr:aldose 1-epimerase [Planctomyces sp.]